MGGELLGYGVDRARRGVANEASWCCIMTDTGLEGEPAIWLALS